jgi:hypothetical protein
MFKAGYNFFVYLSYGTQVLYKKPLSLVGVFLEVSCSKKDAVEVRVLRYIFSWHNLSVFAGWHMEFYAGCFWQFAQCGTPRPYFWSSHR